MRVPRGLAQKWRPDAFAGVLFQPHVVRTLTKAIESSRVSPCYLFVGGRGLGKTSTARIFAKALNCESGPTPTPCGTCPRCQEISSGGSLDVVEIDAASHGKVEDARELIENARLVPAAARFKVYILDESHMLTNAAWNALLKTLEEPPPHCVFILATTEGEKVPETIRSRSIRFDFRPVGEEALAGHLAAVAKKENVAVSAEALRLLARRAEGSVRDALVGLDQARMALGEKLEAADVADLFGLVPAERIATLRAALAVGDATKAHAELETLLSEGRDLVSCARELLESYRGDLLLEAQGKEVALGGGRLVAAMEALIAFFDHARILPDLPLALEVAFGRICLLAREKEPLERILVNLERLVPNDPRAPQNPAVARATAAARVAAVFGPGAKEIR